MDNAQLLREERENTGRVFLYLSGRVLKAYALSAYILTRCFPESAVLNEEFHREKNEMVYTTYVDIDFISEKPGFELLVDDKSFELKCENPEILNNIPLWMETFNQLIREQTKVLTMS